MGFQHDLTVRFYEIDRAGIAFFGRVYEYCHAAFEELLSAALGSNEAMFSTHGFGMPLVHSEADYQAPMRMGDRLRIDVTIKKLGRRSITFGYTVVGRDDAVQRANVTLVHVFVDMAKFESIDAPAVLTDALKEMGLLT